MVVAATSDRVQFSPDCSVASLVDATKEGACMSDNYRIVNDERLNEVFDIAASLIAALMVGKPQVAYPSLYDQLGASLRRINEKS